MHNELLGGHGNDTIFACPTGDVLWADFKPGGGAGQRDKLTGGTGRDFIYGGPGRNIISAGPATTSSSRATAAAASTAARATTSSTRAAATASATSSSPASASRRARRRARAAHRRGSCPRGSRRGRRASQRRRDRALLPGVRRVRRRDDERAVRAGRDVLRPRVRRRSTAARCARCGRCSPSQASDLSVVVRDVEADDETGSAHWTATYTFSATGRKVVNEIDARFRFRDGLAVEHHDAFSFFRWARQALGPAGARHGVEPDRPRARAQAGARVSSTRSWPSSLLPPDRASSRMVGACGSG